MRKIYSTLLLLAAATFGMQAQTETEVTSEYFVNCDMEASADSPEGWETDMSIMYPASQNYGDYPGLVDNFMETWTWGKGLGTHTAIQTAEVPNGLYSMRAMVIATRQDRNDRTTEGVSIFANNDKTPCNTYNGVPELFMVFTEVTDGSLTIGLSIDCPEDNPKAANWVAWDCVQVFRHEGISLAGARLQVLIKEVSAAEFYYMATDIEAELQAALQADPQDAENAEAALARLQAAYAAAQESEAAFSALLAAIDDAEGYYDETFKKAEQLSDAIASAQAMYDAQTATAEEINAEMEALANVLRVYKEANASDDAGIDYSELLVNAGIRKSADGWIFEYDKAPGFSDNVAEFWHWGDYSFNLHQTVTDLPDGRYKISVSGYYRDGDANAAYTKYQNGTETFATLYANNKEVPMMSVHAHSAAEMGFDESRGGVSAAGYADRTWVAEYAFENGYFAENEIEIFLVDQPITIGIKKEKNVGGAWCCFRDFKIIYYGFDAIGLLMSKQDEVEEYMNSKYVSDNPLDNEILMGNYLRLYDAIDASREVTDADEDDVIKSALQELNAIYEAVMAGEADFATYKKQIMEAMDLVDAAELPGIDALKAALADAEAVLANEDAGNDDVVAGIAALDKAIKAYKLSAPASFDEPIEATSVIVNPSFCNIDFDHSSGGSSRGWTWSQVANAGGDLRLNNKSGLNCWNSWNWDFTSMDLHQDIVGLPAGIYALTAKTMTELNRLNDQHAYITTPLMTGATYMTRDDNWEGEWEQLAISQKVLLTEGDTLRIGFASTHDPASSEGSNGWFCVTEFQLYYYGTDDSQLAEDYNNAIDALLEEMMLAGDKAKVQQMKEEAATAQDVKSKFATLAAAIELANNSQNSYNKFAAGAMANFTDEADYVYSEQGQQVAQTAVEQLEALMESDGISYKDLAEIEAALKAYIAYLGTVENAADALEEAENAYTEKLAALMASQAAELAEALADAATVNEYTRLLNAAMDDIQLYLIAEGNGNEDLTYLLENAEVRSNLNGWVVEQSGNPGFNSNVAEYFLNKFDIHQTITVPNGNYTVTVYAQQRPGWNSPTLGEKPTTVVFYANEVEKPIYHCYDFYYVDDAAVPGNDYELDVYTNPEDSSEVEHRCYPNGLGAVAMHFEDGHYLNKIDVDVTDHTLTIGLKETGDANWTAFRDFSIYLNTLGDNEGWVIDTRIDNAQAVPAVQVIDGRIVVNSDNYQVYSIDGKQIAKNAALNKGVYIVRSGAHSLKVLVK